tara:strand:+ start:140 stop:688 length:549 start_codon:yes stop_codon:yes gene_type:complete
MKKLLFILFVFPLASYGQQAQGQAQAQAQATQVTVKSTTVNPVDYNVGIAARAAAMNESSTEVITPLTVDFYDYTHIALVAATCSGGGKDKDCYNVISDMFKFSPLTIINPRDYNKKRFKKNPAYLRTVKNPKWVYVSYSKSIQGVDDIRSLTIRDSQNKVLYRVKTRNVSYEEVVSVLTDI